MGKKLIRSSNIREIYTRGDECVYVTNDLILSPSAKDFIRENNLKIIYGAKTEVENCEVQEKNMFCVEEIKATKHMIVSILEDDFGITDSKTIKLVLEKIMNKI